tara:strand:- start:454 stop:1005 length:552 start_codon:yes stop_codon:yes gene_type:complete
MNIQQIFLKNWKLICYLECLFIYQLQSFLPHPKEIKWIIKKPVKYISSPKKIKFYLFFFFLYKFKKGFRLMFVVFLSKQINEFIKNFIKHKRPYQTYNWIKSDTKKENSYSLPSMSIQYTTIIYPIICDELKIPYLSNILYLLVSSSRILRGLHYPHDVIISTFIGWIIKKIIMDKNFDFIFL